MTRIVKADKDYTVREQLAWGREVLHQQEQPWLEAQVLLAHVLQCDKVKLITWPEKSMSLQQVEHYRQLVARRLQQEPIAYLVGEKEFWSHSFLVTSDTLIPRPETEHLVEVALATLSEGALTVMDLGTGSGMIACVLALMRSLWTVIGVDVSVAALAVAKLNATRLNIPRIQWQYSKWLENVNDQKVDAIISNPPYLSAQDPHLKGDLSFEPYQALVSGETGLEAYEIIIEQAPAVLEVEGWLIFEHGYDQAESVKALLDRAGFKNIDTYFDHGMQPRITKGQLSKGQKR